MDDGHQQANGHTLTFDASKLVRTADENRPKNIALIYAIKAFQPPEQSITAKVGWSEK